MCLLIEARAYVDNQVLINGKPMTALYLACQRGHAAVAHELLRAGASTTISGHPQSLLEIAVLEETRANADRDERLSRTYGELIGAIIHWSRLYGRALN